MGSDSGISDEELAAEAMAADPNVVIPADAVPFPSGGTSAETLPAWYMPAAGSARPTPLRTLVAGLFIAALLSTTAAGVCVTYGYGDMPW